MIHGHNLEITGRVAYRVGISISSYNIQFMSLCENCTFFSALHGVWTSDEKGVCLSDRPFVCLSDAWIVTKWKKDLSRFLYHTKDYLA